MHKLVLLRHGESTWNQENRFTGWTDVELSDRGRDEARDAGRLLKEGGYVPDIAFTSVLKRAIDTLAIEAIEAKRAAAQISPVGPLAAHLGAAVRAGLGEGRRDQIDVVTVRP